MDGGEVGVSISKPGVPDLGRERQLRAKSGLWNPRRGEYVGGGEVGGRSRGLKTGQVARTREREECWWQEEMKGQREE